VPEKLRKIISPDRVIHPWAFRRRLRRMTSGEPKRSTKVWIKPEYTEMRFGFEVTMYIATR
jgi:coenzyme PQQ precursor peptide PqqA